MCHRSGLPERLELSDRNLGALLKPEITSRRIRFCCTALLFVFPLVLTETSADGRNNSKHDEKGKKPPAIAASGPTSVQESGNSGPHVAVDFSEEDYVIGPQDVLAISVWREAELSRAVPVRPDGKISLPLIGEIKASGLRPRELQAALATRLEFYFQKPKVVVIVQEPNSHKFSIIGEVQHPGSYLLTRTMTVLEAIAAAGGFRDFAKVKQTYLLRHMPDGSRKRIPFDYKKALKGGKLDPEVELLPGDTVVVP